MGSTCLDHNHLLTCAEFDVLFSLSKRINQPENCDCAGCCFDTIPPAAPPPPPSEFWDEEWGDEGWDGDEWDDDWE